MMNILLMRTGDQTNKHQQKMNRENGMEEVLRKES